MQRGGNHFHNCCIETFPKYLAIFSFQSSVSLGMMGDLVYLTVSLDSKLEEDAILRASQLKLLGERCLKLAFSEENWQHFT